VNFLFPPFMFSTNLMQFTKKNGLLSMRVEIMGGYKTKPPRERRFLNFLQMFDDAFVVRHGFGDEIPEATGMVEFFQMAEFVDDDVVGVALGQQDDFVVETQVFVRAAASPPSALVFDEKAIIVKAVILVPFFQPLANQFASRFFQALVFFRVILDKDAVLLLALHLLELFNHPFGVLADKPLHVIEVHVPRRGHDHIATTINGQFEPF